MAPELGADGSSSEDDDLYEGGDPTESAGRVALHHVPAVVYPRYTEGAAGDSPHAPAPPVAGSPRVRCDRQCAWPASAAGARPPVHARAERSPPPMRGSRAPRLARTAQWAHGEPACGPSRPRSRRGGGDDERVARTRANADRHRWRAPARQRQSDHDCAFVHPAFRGHQRQRPAAWDRRASRGERGQFARSRFVRGAAENSESHAAARSAARAAQRGAGSRAVTLLPLLQPEARGARDPTVAARATARCRRAHATCTGIARAPRREERAADPGGAGRGVALHERGRPPAVEDRVRPAQGPSVSFFVPGLPPHVKRTELRLGLISYQDYHMLLLTLADRVRRTLPSHKRPFTCCGRTPAAARRGAHTGSAAHVSAAIQPEAAVGRARAR